ncbi:MAG: hypothetical protein E7Z96_05130 [Actinomycetaceae bacterium]|nr:hypothetical protein [Actinomycetaceae bacterium]
MGRTPRVRPTCSGRLICPAAKQSQVPRSIDRRYPSLPLRYPSLPLRYPSLPLRYPSLPLRYPSLPLRYPSRPRSRRLLGVP